MAQPIHLFWFRRDLRLEDNHGLYQALSSENRVFPIFIFDENILESLPKNDARITFIYLQLEEIKKQLQKLGSSLAVYHGKPMTIFKSLVKEYNIQKVFTNHDYEPYAKERDKQIEEFLTSKEIEFFTFKDQVIFEKNEITKKDGDPYVVFTPYAKVWMEEYANSRIEKYDSAELQKKFLQDKKLPFLSLEAIGFKKSDILIEAYDLTTDLISDYKKTRDFPAKNGTSRLSPHLRFGTISIREVVKKANQFKDKTFLKELIWREFFMQILWHFPETVTKSFKPKYDNIKWRNNPKEFELWCEGKTGYPLVDAGMRQLNKTGFMHNRVRMLVASFLCKHLLVDWRWGEAYFAEKLNDYEMSSNIGNWQWAAGSGVDAAPYFRIFNPTTQIEKFDKNYTYIKKWVLEFESDSYSEKMVDHKEARERCLKVYKKAIS
ncbi:deoxyribodipyrimidine photo-lyase [Mesonia sp. K7]|uniref:cryptochrome/photolyase family protein n=1 Tax=Mesonia sp. K7 TaxID=2218606 RepID=UPI000DAA06F5|nr:deoxyribodipyrimidine photo-lyase [Mesonia sp. K7]PZD77848.1 deoxyribodipyrimidine photo-lyase [Mesonia sp. K7]